MSSYTFVYHIIKGNKIFIQNIFAMMYDVSITYFFSNAWLFNILPNGELMMARAAEHFSGLMA